MVRITTAKKCRMQMTSYASSDSSLYRQITIYHARTTHRNIEFSIIECTWLPYGWHPHILSATARVQATQCWLSTAQVKMISKEPQHALGRFGRGSPWWNFGLSTGKGARGPPGPPPLGLSSAGSIFFVAPPLPPKDNLLSLSASKATGVCCLRVVLLGTCRVPTLPLSESGKLSGPSW